MPPIRLRCFFIALVFGWAVADEIAPAAKIGFALAFALLLFARRHLLASFTFAADTTLSVLAMLLVLACSRKIGRAASASALPPHASTPRSWLSTWPAAPWPG